jgi:hypothetical protein
MQWYYSQRVEAREEMVKGGWIDIHQVNITPDQT